LLNKDVDNTSKRHIS